MLTGALRKLTLNGNQLREIAPQIGHLTNLQELHLQGNDLTELPSEMCNLTVSSPCILILVCVSLDLNTMLCCTSSMLTTLQSGDFTA